MLFPFDMRQIRFRKIAGSAHSSLLSKTPLTNTNPKIVKQLDLVKKYLKM